jgi:hypothetical protein
MSDTEIFSFDIAGDRFLDEALALAYCNWCSKEGHKFYGWREHEGVLYLYNRPIQYDFVHQFPAPLTDVKSIIIEWLKNQEWSESGHDFDVHYKRGWRIYNRISYVEMPTYDRNDIGFAVKPYWTEYHK